LDLALGALSQLTRPEPERRFIERRLDELDSANL